MRTFNVYSFSGFENWLKQQHISRKILVIQNHHTFAPSYQQFTGNNHVALMQGMFNYHVHDCGWADIAQNISTFPDGKISLGRDLNTIPAGIKGANANGICIEHIGNFDAGKDEMTDAQKECIISLNALLCSWFKLSPDENNVIYHHWYDLITGEKTFGSGSTKSCPGTNFFGGNSLDSAKQNFYPLIIAKMKSEVTVNPALTALFKGKVTSTALNVRQGPDTSFIILRSLPAGSEVEIFKENNGWYKINPAKDEWVKGQYIQKS